MIRLFYGVHTHCVVRDKISHSDQTGRKALIAWFLDQNMFLKNLFKPSRFTWPDIIITERISHNIRIRLITLTGEFLPLIARNSLPALIKFYSFKVKQDACKRVNAIETLIPHTHTYTYWQMSRCYFNESKGRRVWHRNIKQENIQFFNCNRHNNKTAVSRMMREW